MGRYQGPAQKLVTAIAAAKREKASEDQACASTADNIVGNLQEYAEDVNAALKQHDPSSRANIHVSPWSRQKDGGPVVATVKVSDGERQLGIQVSMPISGEDVTVNGTVIPRGHSAIERIQKEVYDFLKP